VSLMINDPTSGIYYFYMNISRYQQNPPSYRYKYAIEDRAGDGHGKAESREGEQASGRYYVSSKRSLTDVKYTADEWGYHPFVQYGSSDNHSSSSATFAIGERAIANLPNKNVRLYMFQSLIIRDNLNCHCIKTHRSLFFLLI
jgi:hypothetical protein